MNRTFRPPPTPKNYLFGRNAVKRRFVSGAYMLIVCLVILSSAANAPAYTYTSPARQVNSAVSYVWELNASAKSPIFGLDKATAHFEQALSRFDDYEKGIIVAALYLDAIDAIERNSSEIDMRAIEHRLNNRSYIDVMHSYDSAYFDELLSETLEAMSSDAQYNETIISLMKEFPPDFGTHGNPKFLFWIGVAIQVALIIINWDNWDWGF